MTSTTYDHQMSVEMEEWFFGDVAKDEDGPGRDAHPEGETETGCPACGERWHECQHECQCNAGSSDTGETFKRCERCGKRFTRTVFPSGDLEASVRFASRRYCGQACSNHAKHREVPPQECQWCHRLFERRVQPSGIVESIATFQRRRFCSRACTAGFHSGETHPGWKGDSAIQSVKRTRAVRAYKLGACEMCAHPAMDRHHRDGDTGHNARSNIALLCRRCHMVIDGRMEKFIAAGGSRHRPVYDPFSGEEV